MSDNSFKGGGEINPPVENRKDIVIRQNQGQGLSDKLDPRFGEEKVAPLINSEAPPVSQINKKVELAKKEQDPHKRDTPEIVIEKFNESLDKMKEDIKSSQINQKSELTTEQKDAINFLNSITPIDPNTSPASLQTLRDQIKEYAKLLPVGYKNIANSLLSSVASIINQAANNQSSSKELTPEELEAVNTQRNIDREKKLEIDEKAKEADRLFKIFDNEEFKAALKRDAEEEEEKHRHITNLLKDPSSVPLEEKRRLSGDYLSDKEKLARAAKNEEKRFRVNTVMDSHGKSTAVVDHHKEKAKRIEELEAKPELNAAEADQLKRYKEERQADMKEEAHHKAQLEKLDPYRRETVERKERMNSYAEVAKNDPTGDKAILQKKEVLDNFEALQDQHLKDLLQDPENAHTSPVVEALHLHGHHEALTKLANSFNAARQQDNKPTIDFEALIASAILKDGKHEEKLGPKPKIQKTEIQQAESNDLVNMFKKKSTQSTGNKLPPPKPKGPSKGPGR